jgi:thiol:disulfide interchange protein
VLRVVGVEHNALGGMMRNSLVIGLVLVGVAAAGALSVREHAVTTAAATAAMKKIGWEPNLDAALKRAGSENKLVMVDFYTDWCRWCQRFDETTLTDAAVQKELAQVVPVRLNAEKDGVSAATRFNVDGYPTILFLSANGSEVGRIPGYLEAGPFLEELKDIVKRS